MARDRQKAIIEILKAFEAETLIRTWNTYCSDENMDDYIWDNDEYDLNEMFHSADEALRAACYGDYHYSHEYFVINGYGNLESFDKYDTEKYIDFSSLSEYIMDNGCHEISEVWLEDLMEDFMDYANEKFEDKTFNEEDIPADADLVTDDWDDIIEEMTEE